MIQAPLGSIPELPAHSCEEIKASEGKHTISNKYWLDPAATGKAVLVYCDMNLEGNSQLAFILFPRCFEKISFHSVDCFFVSTRVKPLHFSLSVGELYFIPKVKKVLF